MDQIAVVDCLNAHVGKLLVALKLKRLGEFVQVKLQQVRRQALGGDALLQVIAEVIAMHLGQFHR